MRIATTGAAAIALVGFCAAAAAQVGPSGPPKATPPSPSATPAAPSASASAAPQTPPKKKKEPAITDPAAPPTPPSPGLAPPPPAPAPGPVFPVPVTSDAPLEPPIAGWHGSFFLRDPGDHVRLFPRGRLHTDLHSFPSAPVGSAHEGGIPLQPRFFVRRLRFELAGQLFQRWTFLFGVDFGGQGLSNPTGSQELAAAAVGQDPTADSARFAPVETEAFTATIANAFINYSVCPCLNFMLGQHQAPIGMENRTGNNAHTFMERSIAIRRFVVPNSKEVGLFVWGDLFDDRLSYELGVFAGDGPNRPQLDGIPDFIGRIFTRPLLGSKSPIEKLQLGVSGRTGQRDPKFVGYDYPNLTTGQGFALWQPTYKDTAGRTTHILPSGAQNEIGGEFRLPLWIFDFRGEAYYVENNTREALEGYQLTNTERLGTMKGVGWYAQASAWVYGDPFMNGDPGFSRPTTVNLNKPLSKPKKGVEVMGLVSGIHATYEGNSRGGGADAKTPTADTGSAIDILQVGGGLSYWHGSSLRLSLNYFAYITPGSGTPETGPYLNRASVPGNLGKTADPNDHVLHELGGRAAVWF